MNQLFLDCDGVLADFDVLAIQIFGEHPREAEDRLGTDEFWRRLSDYENLYGTLPLFYAHDCGGELTNSPSALH